MTVLANAHVVTMDDAGTELAGGWILIEDGLIAEVGSGPPPEMGDDLAGAVVTPALINTHHHLFQTLTRARAQEADLFTWLKELYPVWARLDAEAEYAAARTNGGGGPAASSCRSTPTSPRLPRRRPTAERSTAAGRSNFWSSWAGLHKTFGARTASTWTSVTLRGSVRPGPALRTVRPPTCASARGSRRCEPSSTRASGSDWASTAPPRTSGATSFSTSSRRCSSRVAGVERTP